MADVASNSTREILNKIHDWEKSQDSLAPLSTFQRNVVLDLSEEVAELSINEVCQLPTPKALSKENEIEPPLTKRVDTLNIESTNQFLNWYSQLEDEWLEEDDLIYTSYLNQLTERRDECANLLSQVESSLSHLNDLNKEYRSVSNKTNSLHQVSEQLLADQMKLSDVNSSVNDRMHHFKNLPRLAQRLESPALSVASDSFVQLLDQLDDAINYMKSHGTFKECSLYLARYEHCLARAVNLIKSYIFNVLIHATEQTASTPSSDVSHYARFQASAHKIKPILSMIEQRSSKFSEYDNLLSDCQQCYISQRESLISQSVIDTITELASNREGDYCSLTRSACAFLIHVSQDELRLYQQFFCPSDFYFCVIPRKSVS
uniref:Conserved oligomeric Golgi complex subunit 3 n=1 Tax=Clastoptera arizonana TaxID=38151 RepID=A0A1B6C2I1_9HEMI